MKLRFALGALVALFAFACGQAPTAPNVSPSGLPLPGVLRSDADASSPLEMRALAGRFTNILSGAAAAGITLSIEGVGNVAGDAAG